MASTCVDMAEVGGDIVEHIQDQEEEEMKVLDNSTTVTTIPIMDGVAPDNDENNKEQNKMEINNLETIRASVESEDIIESNFQDQEDKLKAFLEERNPKPKRLSFAERLKSMPGYDKIINMKPKLGGSNTKPDDFIDFDDDKDSQKKPKKQKNEKGIQLLMQRFARHACSSNTEDDFKPKHIKIHVNKLEKDSQGMLQNVVDEIDYVTAPPIENDIVAKLNRPSGGPEKEQVPGEKLYRLKQALQERIRAEKTKMYEEKLKEEALYENEKQLQEKCDDDYDLPEEDILDEENEEITDSEEEDELEEILLGEKREKKKIRKRIAFVDDEAEDEDGDDRSSESDDEESDDEEIEELSDCLEDIEEEVVKEEEKKEKKDVNEEKENDAEDENSIPEKIFDTPEPKKIDDSAELMDIQTPLEIDQKHNNQESSEFSIPEPIVNLLNCKETISTHEELVDLCSGVFPSQAPATPEESQECFGFDFNDDLEADGCSEIEDNVVDCGTKDSVAVEGLEVKVEDKEDNIDQGKLNESIEQSSFPIDKSQSNYNSPPVDSDEEDEETIGAIKVIKKKRKRLLFSDDEDEEDGINESAEVEDDENKENFDEFDDAVEDEEEIFDEDDEDDEEAELEKQLQAAQSKPKGLFFGKDGRIKKKFVEAEAELSGSEEGSEDEDERGLNFYEKEEGDEEDFDVDDVRDQVGKTHLKLMLDNDDREIRLLQEEYLERGDLEGDGQQRERKFRWTNVNGEWNDDHAMMGDSDGELEDDQEEQKQRLADIERRKWITENSQLIEASEEESQNKFFETSKILKLGKNTRKKIESFVENSSSFILNETSCSMPEFAISTLVKSKIKASSSAILSKDLSNEKQKNDDEDEFKICKSTSQLLFASPDDSTRVKRGSFLSRGSPSLSRLAELTKVNDPVNNNSSNVKTNSRNFVFSVVTPPDQASKIKGPRRPNSQGMPPTKIPKMDRSFSNLDNTSKDASIFKWF